jgi:hypothetical protein
MPYQQPYMINQQPSQGYGMSDQDIMRLAQALQQQRGEGLAFINPDEQALLKALGGAGQPMPGTQGLGVGGGPIRSYADDTTDDATLAAGQSPGVGSAPAEKTAAEKAYEAAQQGYDYVTGRPLSSGNGDGGGTTAPPPPPAPKYKDQYGNEFATQEEANASDTAINSQKTNLENALSATIKADTTYQQLQDAGQLAAYDKVSEDDIKAIFEKQARLAVEESKGQINTLQDSIGSQLSQMDQPQLETLQYTSMTFPDGLNRLSEQKKREIFDQMKSNALREARFTLTPEEVAQFAREAPEVAAVGDAEAPTIGEIEAAEGVTVGEVAAADAVTIAPDGTPTVDETALQEVRAAEDQLIEQISARMEDQDKSVAYQQLRQTTEQNLRALLGAQAGAPADPARLRQIRQIYADTQQAAVGQAAQLRAAETVAAEQQLIDIYKTRGTRELSVALANLETERQIAIQQANLDQARNLSVMETQLTRVITQANLDRDIELANLEARKQKMIEQGKLDLATALANMQKDLAIATTNAELALRSRALDDAVALANYQGQQALEGIDQQLYIANMEADLKELGLELQMDMAELDAQTRITIAKLARKAQQYAADSAERGAFISALATFGATMITSDIRLKMNIKQGEEPRSEIDEFLDNLSAYLFRYKDPGSPGQKGGEQLGVMAQDLMQSDIGKQMVHETPMGLKVDYQSGLAAILAAQADMNDRLKELEGRR